MGVAQLVTPNENPLAPLKANRAMRRLLARAKRLQDKRQLRHDIKKSLSVRTREQEKRVRACPGCDLDFLGKIDRCQCSVFRTEFYQKLDKRRSLLPRSALGNMITPHVYNSATYKAVK